VRIVLLTEPCPTCDEEEEEEEKVDLGIIKHNGE
jgi:hypothetical protein